MSSTPRPPRRSFGSVGLALVVAAGLTIGVTTAFALQNLTDSTGETTAGSPSTSLVSDGSSPTSASPSTAAPTTAPPTTETPTTTTPPTTAAPTTTTTPPPPPPPSYRRGDSGPEVAALQQRLIDLNFWIPAADGNYGSMTSQAVMAFQKFVGLGRDGVAGPNTLAALQAAVPAGPREGGDHIEVDLERQVMMLVRGDRIFVFNTSTGRSGWRTPPGRFTITRQIDGVRRAELGDLYRPKYFNGGIALHGSPSIPAQPASHGCSRLHNAVVDHIWGNDLVPIGTPVWVY